MNVTIVSFSIIFNTTTIIKNLAILWFNLEY